MDITEENTMKIAVASDDSKNISDHFGRARGFVIFSIDDDKKIITQEYKKNIGRHQDACGTCNHEKMIDNLSGCALVISHGMGRRIFDDLMKHGIKPVVTNEKAVDKALEGFLRGDLSNHTEKLH
ncbi:MAG: NifB/NifX family molybdenum-iron cluster-binding protein [Nanoarchaeota archaeon]